MSQGTPKLPESLQRAIQKDGNRFQKPFSVERRSLDEDKRTVELAFASETEYERWWGIEILRCASENVMATRLETGANLLVNHNADDVIGVVESISYGADRVLRAVVRFGRSVRAEEVWQDVKDGIRRSVSVGYMIHDALTTGKRDGVEVVEVTRWEPFEISLVSIPADATVGVGRSAELTPAVAAPEQAPIATPQPSTQEIRTMEKPDAGATATATAAPVVQVAEKRDHAKEISTLAAQMPGSAEIAMAAIQRGATVEEFQRDLIKRFESRPVRTDSSLDLTEKETKRYSLLNAIRAMVDNNWQQAGFERECSEAVLKKRGIAQAPNGGFMVPYELLTAKRDLTAGTPSQGGFLVATNNDAASFIDIQRNRSLVTQFGARFLSGLQGNLTIPRQTGASTVYWLANEATEATESQIAFGQLAMAPKHVVGYTEISRQLMMQSSPAADGLVTTDLAASIALGIDAAALNGAGSGGAPLGVINTAGIGSVTGTSLDWAKVLEFQTDLANANMLGGSLGYMTTPTVAALLAARQRFSSTDTPLWTGNILDGQLGGFRAATTLQIPAASMLFGDFSQIIIGEWGSLEIAMNPYANFKAAITGIRAIQSVDIGVRIPAGFSYATSIT